MSKKEFLGKQKEELTAMAEKINRMNVVVDTLKSEIYSAEAKHSYDYENRIAAYSAAVSALKPAISFLRKDFEYKLDRFTYYCDALKNISESDFDKQMADLHTHNKDLEQGN